MTENEQVLEALRNGDIRRVRITLGDPIPRERLQSLVGSDLRDLLAQRIRDRTPQHRS